MRHRGNDEANAAWRTAARFRWAGLVAGMLIALELLAPDAHAHAHGGVTRIGEGRAGPYNVAVLASRSPRVGETDISVAVSNSGGTAVNGVSVDVSAAPVGAATASPPETMRYHAEPESGTPGTYHALVRFATSGRWELRVQVTGPRGSGEALLSTTVSPSVWGVTPTELVAASLPLVVVIALVALRRLGGARRRTDGGAVIVGGGR